MAADKPRPLLQPSLVPWHPQILVNPISTRGEDYAHNITNWPHHIFRTSYDPALGMSNCHKIQQFPWSLIGFGLILTPKVETHRGLSLGNELKI